MNHALVCEVFSKFFQKASSLVDITSIIIGGYHPNENLGYIWNQVKINGKW